MLYNGHKIKTPRYVIKLARQQRQNLTASEQIIWSQLGNKQLDGYRFRCQHPIFRYILDFYCHNAHLAIEIDGNIHINRKEYDNYRDEFLESIGIRTLRISSNEVFSNIEHVVYQIKNILLNKSL